MNQHTKAQSLAKTRDRSLMLPLGASLLALTLAAWGFAAKAEDQKVIVSNGISTFGELKYGPDFQHLDYVNPEAPKGGEISEWAPGTFDSVNPYSIKGIPAALASTPYEAILQGTSDEIGAAYCYMCETMEYPEDRSWVIFNLRHDVTFSDGTPMTAADIEFSYKLFTEKGIPEFRAVFNSKVQSVEVLDPYKIKFTFTPGTPFRDMPASVGGLTVMSKKDFEDHETDLEASTLTPFLGTGPYMIDKIQPGQQITFKRNPKFWGAKHPLNIGRNNFDNIRIEYFGDPNAAFEAFKSGVYTFRNENSSKQWATAYDFPGVKNGSVVKAELPSGAIGQAQAFLINLRRDKFKDSRVREAIGLMFNFEWSNQTLFYGIYTRVTSIFANTNMEAKGPASPAEAAILQPLVDQGLLPATILTDEAVLPPTSNPDSPLDRRNLRKASALLDEAGWLAGDDGMRRNAKGEPLTIEFLEDQPTFERVIAPYVQNLRALGIDASLNIADAAQVSQRTDPPNFDFDIIVGSAINGYEPGGEMQQGYASSTANNSTRNRAGVSDPAVDKLLDGLEAAKTREELDVSAQAFDRVMRAMRFWVPQWYKNIHTVAYYDQYDHPATLPPYALGEMDFWWYDADKAAKLKASGALK
jgi:microcin C transport system substrate-binding protein